MRIILFSSLILAGAYFFSQKSETKNQLDSVKMALSAPERGASKSKPIRSKAAILGKSSADEAFQALAEPSGLEDVEEDSFALEDDSETEHTEEISESTQEKSWEDELGQVVQQIEPEYGEEMFESYTSERKSYQAKLDELIRNNQKNHDLELLISELEHKHEERVKEIFGRHYEEIKDHQAQFLESQSH